LLLHETQGLKLDIEESGIPVGEGKKREIFLILLLAQNVAHTQSKISMSFRKSQ